MQKSVVQLCFVIFLSAFLVRCPGSDPKPFDGMSFDNRDDANAAILNLQVACEDPAQCPEAVGGLASFQETIDYSGYRRATSYHMGVCSQTLIAPDLVLTNRHCIPDSLTYVGADCSELTLFFPKTSQKPFERVGCQSVVDLSASYSKDVKIRPDWAILRLKRSVQRTPVKTDASGIPHGTELNVYPVYYYYMDVDSSSGSGKGVAYGTIKKLDCRASMNHIMSPFFNHASSPVVSSHCNKEIINGNSGSGIFSKQGLLTGALSFGFSDEPAKGTFMGKPYSVNRENVGGGSNLRCIPLLSPYSATAPCRFEPDSSGNSYVVGMLFSMSYGQEISKDSMAALDQFVANDTQVTWGEHNPEFFKAIDSDRTIEDMGKQYQKHAVPEVSRFSFQSTYPQTPLCISGTQKNEPAFSLKIPTTVPSRTGMNLAETGLYEVPMELEFIEFEMTYSSVSGGFEGVMKRLPPDLAQENTERQDALGSATSNCFLADTEKECQAMKTLEEDYNQFVENSSYDRSLFMNEMVIAGRDNRDNPKISVPVCSDDAS